MAKEFLDLTGKWQFKQYPVSARRMRDLDEGNWLDCNVPSSIYMNLTDAGVIDRDKLNQNPDDFFQPSLEPWIYKKNFDVPADFLKSEKIELVFDGLDTFGQIWLNEKLIARTDNMFCQYRFDVTSLLKPRDNSLMVKFDSAVEEGKRLMERFGLLSEDRCSLPQRAYVRKAQCQFGWDWAPVLPGCGIWQAARLEIFKTACIRDTHIATIDCDKAGADIKIAIQIENFSSKSIICNFAIIDPAGQKAAEMTLDFGDSRRQNSAVVNIASPRLWQPNTYGSQPLYTLSVKLSADGEIVDSTSKTFGIRTIKIHQAQIGRASCRERV
jgi:beta-mannosidase